MPERQLYNVRDIPAYAVMIRAEWCRGQPQLDAFNELRRRGLWLTYDQAKHAASDDVKLWQVMFDLGIVGGIIADIPAFLRDRLAGKPAP